eukprot:6469161-Amphidinium_carterae.2
MLLGACVGRTLDDVDVFGVALGFQLGGAPKTLTAGATGTGSGTGIGGLVGSACTKMDETSGVVGAMTVTHSDSVDDGSPVASSTSWTGVRKLAAWDVRAANGGPVPIDDGALDAREDAVPEADPGILVPRLEERIVTLRRKTESSGGNAGIATLTVSSEPTATKIV